MSMLAVSLPAATEKPPSATGFRTAFVVAWLFCLLFYFMEYAVRSAPSVMLPELTKGFGLSTVGVSSLIGLYYYSYAVFAIIAGASVDRWGAKYTIPVGVLILAVGTAMFGARRERGRRRRAVPARRRCRFRLYRGGVPRVAWPSGAISRDRDRHHPMRWDARRIRRWIACRAPDPRTDDVAASLDRCGHRDVVDRSRDVHRNSAVKTSPRARRPVSGAPLRRTRLCSRTRSRTCAACVADCSSYPRQWAT